MNKLCAGQLCEAERIMTDEQNSYRRYHYCEPNAEGRC